MNRRTGFPSALAGPPLILPRLTKDRSGRCIGAVVLMSAMTYGAASIAAGAPQEWPRVRLPDSVTVFPIGDRMTVGGMPMRIAGFVSAEPPQRLLPALRRSLGQPLADSMSGDRHLLGRPEGRFYLTVQVVASGEGSRGIVSLADLQAVGERQTDDRDDRWLDRLPSGSTVSSDVASVDAGKVSRHRVLTNGHSESVNREAVLRLLQGEGYRLEREMRAARTGRPALPAQFADATALYFAGPAKEATAVIVRQRDRTAVILNTVSETRAGR